MSTVILVENLSKIFRLGKIGSSIFTPFGLRTRPSEIANDLILVGKDARQAEPSAAHRRDRLRQSR